MMMAPTTTRTGRESAHRLSDCVTALLRDQPFFGSLALRLPIRADASRETIASDGHEIRYSPQWVADTDADLIKTAIGRVVLACTLKHHTRRRERDPERWQRASQVVTHGLLRDAGFTLPPDAEAWEGLSVEQAYNRLPEPEDGDEGGNDRPASGGGCNVVGSQSATGDDDPAADGSGVDSGDTSDQSHNGDPQDKDGPGTGGGSDAPNARSTRAHPHPFLSDRAVRKALSMAIDRELLVEIGYGQAARPTCNVVRRRRSMHRSRTRNV